MKVKLFAFVTILLMNNYFYSENNTITLMLQSYVKTYSRINHHMAQVHAKNDFEKKQKILKVLFFQLGTIMSNASSTDISEFNRIILENIKNKTSLGVRITNVSKIFHQHYLRISQINGGTDFLQSLVKIPDQNQINEFLKQLQQR